MKSLRLDGILMVLEATNKGHLEQAMKFDSLSAQRSFLMTANYAKH